MRTITKEITETISATVVSRDEVFPEFKDTVEDALKNCLSKEGIDLIINVLASRTEKKEYEKLLLDLGIIGRHDEVEN